MIVWTLQEPPRQWYSRQLRIASTWTRSGATACPNCLPGFFNDFDIIERASCQTGFSDEAVGLTMNRQCAAGATFTSVRNCTPSEVFSSGTTMFQEAFERMTKDTTATAPFTMKIKGGCPPIGNIFTVDAKRFHCAEVLPTEVFAVVWLMGRPVSKSQQFQCKEQLRFVSASRFLFVLLRL